MERVDGHEVVGGSDFVVDARMMVWSLDSKGVYKQ